MTRRGRGFFLIEALLALAMLSVIVLVMVNSYRGVTRSLNQSRLQKQASQFAQAELQKYSSLARVPQRTSAGALVLAGGLPVAEGYHRIVSDAVEQAVYYPDAAMGSEAATFSKERYLLFRRISVSTVNAGAPDEHRRVSVVLRDSRDPPRFSPVAMETLIRRPHPASLDLRSAVDAATLSVQITDASTNGAIPAVHNPTARLCCPTADSGAIPPPGAYTFPNLNTQGTYLATFSAAGYWREIRSGISLSAGPNAPAMLNPIALQPVYYSTVSALVLDYNGGAPAPLAGASLKISDAAATPSLANCCGVANSSVYDPVNAAADGRALKTIPIPVKSSETYGPGRYRVEEVKKSGYFTETPYAYVTLARGSLVDAGTFTLYPVRYASLQVHVQDANGTPAGQAQVAVYDSSGNILKNPSDVSIYGLTDYNGDITFPSVPVNTSTDKLATTRNVKVRVRRVTYKQSWTNSTISYGSTSNMTVVLDPHTYVLRPKPVSEPSAPASVLLGANLDLKARGCYAGHPGGGPGSCCGNDSNCCRCDELDVAYGGISGVFESCASPISRAWSWALQNNGKGYISPLSSTSQDWTRFTAIAAGGTRLDVSQDFSFTMTCGSYGPSGTSVSFPGNTASFHIDVANSGSAPSLSVSVAGPSTVAPSSSNNYTATVSFGSNPLPGDLAYSWSVSGPGTLSATASQAVSMLAGDSSHIGQTVTLTVTAASASLGQSVSANYTVTINYPSLAVSLPYSGQVVWTPNSDHAITATVSGGSGSRAFDWTMLDPTGAVDYGNSHAPEGSFTSDGTASTVFHADSSGSARLRLTVTDSVTGASASAQFDLLVQPPGSSP